MVLSVLAVYPSDSVADWELRLTATAQHQEKVILLHIASLRKDRSVVGCLGSRVEGGTEKGHEETLAGGES